MTSETEIICPKCGKNIDLEHTKMGSLDCETADGITGFAKMSGTIHCPHCNEYLHMSNIWFGWDYQACLIKVECFYDGLDVL